MKRMIKTLVAVVAASMLTLVCSAAAFANDGAPIVDLKYKGKTFTVTDKTVIDFGHSNPANADIQVVRVNGHELVNVGTKSGVLDSMGRTVLEYNPPNLGVRGNKVLRLKYHAEDDPVVENQLYGFEIFVKVALEKQTVKVKVASKKYKATTLAKKSKSFAIGAKAKTDLTYKVVKAPAKAKKYITVSKKGKVTMKKGAKKGTYKVAVTAKSTYWYAKAKKIVVVKVA